MGQPSYKGLFLGNFPIAIVYFNLQEMDSLSTKNRVADPMVSLLYIYMSTTGTTMISLVPTNFALKGKMINRV